MSPQMTKRHFVKESMLMTAGAALGVSGRALGADARQPIVPKATLPMGKIGDISISRLILGGNIMTAYAHARGLRYVKDLMRRYHTPEKILETLRIAEEHGINMLVVPARHIGDVLQRYRHEVGGKMQYMIYSVPNPSDPEHELDGFKEAIDKGADITYIHGDPGYRLIKAGKVDSFKRAVEFAKDHGLQVGVSAHYLEVIRACEEAKIGADFYLKTFHGNRYGSAPRPGEAGSPGSELNDGAFDNSWCRDPREVAEYMRSINKPWIAFKVMAAGAIPPREGFTHAFSNGADFVLAGMFDWQIEEDTSIAREVIASVERPYPWRA